VLYIRSIHDMAEDLRRDGHLRYRIRYQRWKLPSCQSAMNQRCRSGSLQHLSSSFRVTERVSSDSGEVLDSSLQSPPGEDIRDRVRSLICSYLMSNFDNLVFDYDSRRLMGLAGRGVLSLYGTAVQPAVSTSHDVSTYSRENGTRHPNLLRSVPPWDR
jgi:hypothetical protein